MDNPPNLLYDISSRTVLENEKQFMVIVMFDTNHTKCIMEKLKTIESFEVLYFTIS